jgi:hypothetical protein
MANEMQTFVTVKSNEPRVAKRLQEIFKSRKGTYEVDAIDVINNLEGTSYCFKNEKEDFNLEVDFPSSDVWDSIIGPKWMQVEFDYSELPEDCHIVLSSAWSVPIPFLLRLRDELQLIDEDCYLKGTYEDESFDPSGAFIVGKYDYDDMEDTDESYDWDEYEQDDFYQERWYEELNEMASNLEIAYIEYLKEREENPQDYE